MAELSAKLPDPVWSQHLRGRVLYYDHLVVGRGHLLLIGRAQGEQRTWCLTHHAVDKNDYGDFGSLEAKHALHQQAMGMKCSEEFHGNVRDFVLFAANSPILFAVGLDPPFRFGGGRIGRRTAVDLVKGTFAEQHDQLCSGSLQAARKEVQIHEATAGQVEFFVTALDLFVDATRKDQAVGLEKPAKPKKRQARKKSAAKKQAKKVATKPVMDSKPETSTKPSPVIAAEKDSKGIYTLKPPPSESTQGK